VTAGGSHAPTAWGWSFVGAAFVIPCVVWLVTNRVAPVPRGKVGVALAITCDDEKHDRQVRADFIMKLQELLTRDPQSANFHLIVLPRHRAERVVALPDANHESAKLRAHFMLYGTVRRRVIRGRESHVIAFEGVVRHALVPASVQNDLASDFTNVLPRRVTLAADSDVFAFEATAEWADVSARYIIGLAALISGDVAYAERLFLDVERRMASGRPGIEPLRQISNRLPERFRTLYDAWLRHLTDGYTMTRERSYLERADQVATKLLARDPRHPGAKLMKAIAEFSLRRNIAAARDLVSRARLTGDATWRYSLAFLDAYEGNLDAAEAEYQRAFKGPLNDVTVPVQCEEFIAGVIQEEPNRVQLHYCSGLINYYAKRDCTGATRDFMAFLSATDSQRFPRQRAAARQLIEDCRDTSTIGAEGPGSAA
jgi:hypothetical protein